MPEVSLSLALLVTSERRSAPGAAGVGREQPLDQDPCGDGAQGTDHRVVGPPQRVGRAGTLVLGLALALEVLREVPLERLADTGHVGRPGVPQDAFDVLGQQALIRAAGFAWEPRGR